MNGPELHYRTATDRAERQRIRKDVVVRYLPQIEALTGDREALMQEGIVGLLIALEKWTPERGDFWPFALPFLRRRLPVPSRAASSP